MFGITRSGLKVCLFERWMEWLTWGAMKEEVVSGLAFPSTKQGRDWKLACCKGEKNESAVAGDRIF